MDVTEAINTRMSIRTYKTDQVPIETIMKVLDTIKSAPSWGNKQCWRFIIVRATRR